MKILEKIWYRIWYRKRPQLNWIETDRWNPVLGTEIVEYKLPTQKINYRCPILRYIGDWIYSFLEDVYCLFGIHSPINVFDPKHMYSLITRCENCDKILEFVHTKIRK